MLHLWCESPESSLFQWGMDSGSALHFARNDDFDQSTSQSSQPALLPSTSPNATDQVGWTDRTGLNRIAPDRPRPSPCCPEQTPRAFDGHHKRTSPQRQWRCRMAGTNPAINDPRFGISERTIAPLATDPARRSGQTDPNPPSQARCPRHCQPPPTTPRTDPVALNRHPPPSVDAANAPHPKGNGVAAWQTHKSRHRSPAFRHLRTHHRPAGNQSCQPIPATRPTDPVQTQFGPADSRHCHTSPTGLAPDWTELDLTSFASPRLSLPRTNALALRTHLSRHDKHPFS